MFRKIIYKLKQNNMFGSSFRSRLIVYFVLSVLIPIGTISVALYHESSSILTNKVDQLIRKNLSTAEVSIQQKIEAANDISTMISFNPRLMDIIDADKPQEYLKIIGEMGTLNDIIEQYYLSNLSNFTKTTFLPRIYMMDRPEYKGFRISDKVFNISEIQNEQWYKNFGSQIITVAGKDKVQTMTRSFDSIKIARKLFSTKYPGSEPRAVLTIDIETNTLNDILESTKSSPMGSAFIIDDKGAVILKTKDLDGNMPFNEADIKEISDNKTEYKSFVKKINGMDMLVSVKNIGNLKWNIVSISPIKELNKELNEYSKFVFVVIIICSLLSLMVALVLSNDIARPIRKLVKSMSHVKEGNFDINISYNRNDEFAFLVQHYKSMINEIKELIDKLYVSELKQKEVEIKAREYELKALQAQINPHFLYNTLDSVNWLALQYKAYDISTMVKSLSNFFRYSLSKGKSIITLEEEKGQAESYLTIQRIRFKEKLNYKIEFTDEILKCKTVKLILQPIVENAIIHGLERRKTGGFIDIAGYKKEDYIEIKVSDNGEGADIEELNNLLMDKTSEDAFFGTRNVNDRIKQFFGEEYGLRFLDNEAGGVTVLIKIPFNE